MKKILIISASFLVLLACAFFGAWHWLNARISPAYIANLTQKTLGSPLKIADEPKISFFPLALSLNSANFDYTYDDLKITLAVEACNIKLAILPLLNGNVEIEEVFLEKPVAEAAYFVGRDQTKAENPDVKHDAFNNANQSPAKNVPDNTVNQNNQPGAAQAQTNIPVKRLIAKNGNFIFNNNINKFKLENINFIAENLDKKNTWNIKSDFGIQIFSAAAGQGENRILDGNLAFKTNLHYYRPTLTFRQGQITFTAKTDKTSFTPLSVAFDGALNYSLQEYNISNANITIPQGSINLTGKGNYNSFSGRSASELSLPALLRLAGVNPANIQNNFIFMEGRLELNNKNFSYNDVVIKCAGTDGSGQLYGWFAQNNNPANINANLSLGDININKFLTESANSASHPPKPAVISQMEKNRRGSINKTKNAGNVSEKKSENKPENATAINYAIDCKIKSIRWDKILTEKLNFKITCRENLIDLNNLTFEWAQGHVRGNGEANLTLWQYKLDLAGEKLILGNILSQLGENNIKGGATNFSGHLEANGDSLNELLETIAGNLQINCQNAQIPALEEIARMLPIPGGSKFVFPHLVNNLNIQCAATKGIAACKPLSFTAGSLRGSGNGIINIPDNRIDGNLILSTLGVNLPVNFNGNFKDLSWSMGNGFFDELRKLIP